jgi:hypothetical protein
MARFSFPSTLLSPLARSPNRAVPESTAACGTDRRVPRGLAACLVGPEMHSIPQAKTEEQPLPSLQTTTSVEMGPWPPDATTCPHHSPETPPAPQQNPQRSWRSWPRIIRKKRVKFDPVSGQRRNLPLLPGASVSQSSPTILRHKLHLTRAPTSSLSFPKSQHLEDLGSWPI